MRYAVRMAVMILALPVFADVVVQPVAVLSNTMGDQPPTPIANLISQGGLSPKYTSGVTDFDTYLSATPHATGSDYWNSAAFSTSGSMIFDLGSVYDIAGMALWQHSNFFSQAIAHISIDCDVDGDFSSGSAHAGDFFFVPILEPKATVLPFAQTTTRYVKCTFTNYGNGFGTRANEVAFRGVLVPPAAQVSARQPCTSPAALGSLAAPAGAPKLGSVFQLAVDDPAGVLGLPPVSTLTTSMISLAPAVNYPCGAVVPGWGTSTGLGGELLIDTSPSVLLFTGPLKFWLGPGNPSVFSIGVPASGSIAGVTLFAQGAYVTPVASALQIVLTEGLDLVLGT